MNSRDIGRAKSLKPGDTVQVIEEIREVGGSRGIRWPEPGVDYTVASVPEFQPNAYRGTSEENGKAIYQDNVLVTITDGKRTMTLSYKWLV